MGSLETQFQNIIKKVRQESVTKMQSKMERAAEKVVQNASRYRDFHDVTGNLYKSIAAGTYYKGTLMTIHHTPGPSPTRATLAKGERYNLESYYGGQSVTQLGRPYRGETGAGGERGEEKAEELLFDSSGDRSTGTTWQLKVVAAVSYAKYVETAKQHDVITGLRDYMARYFKKM